MKYLPGDTTPELGQEVAVLGCMLLRAPTFPARHRPTELCVCGANRKCKQEKSKELFSHYPGLRRSTGGSHQLAVHSGLQTEEVKAWQ